MQRLLRRTGSAVAVAAVCLVVVPSAMATTANIGSTITSASGFGAGATLIVLSTGPTSPRYVVPAGGTKISSFSVQGNTTTGSQVELKVFRTTKTANTWKTIGSSIAETIKPSVLNTFAVSIAVKPGDVLGLTDVAGSAPMFGSSSSYNAKDTLSYGAGNPAVGANFTPSSPSPGMIRLNVSAVVQLAPLITKVAPTSGPTTGHTTVTITGSHFTGATKVNFGATTAPALSFHVVSDTQITAVSPAHAAGTVDVRVLTPGGYSPITTLDHFTF